MTDATLPDYLCSAKLCRASRPRLPGDTADSYARAAGWHVWGNVALCPDHAGNAKRVARPQHLDGEQPLW